MTNEANYVPPEEAPEWGLMSNWAWRTGEPGALGEETARYGTCSRLFVARDEAGDCAAVLFVRVDAATLAPYALIAVTRPDRRRQGLASGLFSAAAAAGIPVEELSGANGLTADGAAFLRARRARGAGLPISSDGLEEPDDV